MKKILFICTGNTCRSPMAEIILKEKLKLAGIKGIKVSSAGLNALDGEKISENSKTALKMLGYKVYGFKSKTADGGTLIKSDLIICMSKSHKNAISHFPNVYTVAELTGLPDISDPYGGDLSVYVKTSHQIEDACNVILDRIIINGEKKI